MRRAVVRRRSVSVPCILVFALAGFSAYTATPGEKKWEFQHETGIGVEGSAALGTNGVVYIGSHDQNVYALDAATGAMLWQAGVGLFVASSPAIGPDGTVYIGSYDEHVYALDGATGATKWRFDAGICVHSCPALDVDGTVYVGGIRMYALDGQTGGKKWEHIPGSVYCSPAIGKDGTVYFAADHLYALDSATGARRWSVDIWSSLSSPTIGEDGTVFIGTENAIVYAVDGQTGVLKWALTTEGRYVRAAPIVGPGNVVYVSDHFKLYALNGATGEKLWDRAIGAEEIFGGYFTASTPAIAADGTLYIGTRESGLYALDTATGSNKWTFATSGSVLSSPVIGHDGVIYFATFGAPDSVAQVYAVHGASGPAQSAWPSFRRTPDGRARMPAIPRFDTDANKFTSEGFQLTVLSEPGTRATIQITSNLLEWAALRDITNESGRLELLDSAAAPLRFYRIASENQP